MGSRIDLVSYWYQSMDNCIRSILGYPMREQSRFIIRVQKKPGMIAGLVSEKNLQCLYFVTISTRAD
jgi:hypothetical protein